MSKTIMFIHGAWLNATSWDTFRAYFEARGYTTLAESGSLLKSVSLVPASISLAMYIYRIGRA